VLENNLKIMKKILDIYLISVKLITNEADNTNNKYRMEGGRMKRKLYQEIATLINARENCDKSGNKEWFDKHTERLMEIAENGPSGSGIDIDKGTVIDLAASTSEKIVLFFHFHHMDEMGGYDGWTEYKITVRPSLQFGFNMKISGRDRNGAKEYLYQVYEEWLNSEHEYGTV